jgi:hypothetical protein
MNTAKQVIWCRLFIHCLTMLSAAETLIIDFLDIIHCPAFYLKCFGDWTLSLTSGIEPTQLGQIDRLVAQIYAYKSVSLYYITYESICCITAMYLKYNFFSVCYVVCHVIMGCCFSDGYLLNYLIVTATCFRNAKSFEQCKECLLKAADCHRQNRSYPFQM